MLRRCLVVALLGFLSSYAWAQEGETTAEDSETRFDEIFARGCGDDDGTDRCDADVQRRMRELYGLVDVEALAEQGVTLRRAMFVDGYGNDVVAVTFSRAPGRSPTIEISTPRSEQTSESQPLSAVTDHSVWQRVLDSSRHFDERLESEGRRSEPDEEGTITFCLHGWFTVVEALDAARLIPNLVGQEMEPARIRSDAEGVCAGGLAAPYAFELAEIALRNLRECSSLKSEYARGDPALLALCYQMRGDRIAAGEAYEFVHELDRMQQLPEGSRLRWLFAESGHDLARGFREALDGGSFELGAPNAIDVDHAEVEGFVTFRPREGQNEILDIKLRLVRQTGQFVIESYEISERRPLE